MLSTCTINRFCKTALTSVSQQRLYTTMADKLKVIIFMGSMREGRLCERVTKYIQNGLDKRGCYEVEVFG